jgi:hypothetical protein
MCYCLKSRDLFYSNFENISIGGMCLDVDRLLSPDELIKFKIGFPEKTVRGEGKIVWNKYLPDSEEVKAGVEFTNLGSQNRDFLADFISGSKH